MNFNKLGLKKLITTSYKPYFIANTQLGLFRDDPTLLLQKGRSKENADKFVVSEVTDLDSDGDLDLEDITKQLKENKHNEWKPLREDGDFRSEECI